MAKIGFGLAYLWYIWDFFWIHFAIWNSQLGLLLIRATEPVFSGDPDLDVFLRSIALFFDRKTVVWIILLTSPLVVGFYLWGRRRWLQFAVGCWMSASIIAMTALIDFFHSTADVWVNFVFIAYSLTALVSSNEEWEKNESGFSLSKWKADPVLASTYASLVVLIQFSVYFFAGVNKLVDGWVPWTTGVAIQNLMAFDNSVHEFAQGTYVPYWLSLILCYVTLFQRLVVPFGFFFRRYRIWTVLILGTMHIGYAILMYVNLFPLIGIASLLMVLPSRTAPVLETSSRKPRRVKKAPKQIYRSTFAQGAVICLFIVCLFGECLRLTCSDAAPLEKTLLAVPNWRMFANGGATPNGEWRLILDTPGGEIDATEIALQPLPHLWRDRFYINMIYSDLLRRQGRPGTPVDRLVKATEKMYGARQLQLNGNPVILGAHFNFVVKTQTIRLPVVQRNPQGS
ncbi:MAG: HTTM domain-containing protein [Edaphobacter sp.]